MNNIIADDDQNLDLAFEILETTEATAMEEMGASGSATLASSSCSVDPTTIPPQ